MKVVMGNLPRNGLFSMAMINNQRVNHLPSRRSLQIAGRRVADARCWAAGAAGAGLGRRRRRRTRRPGTWRMNQGAKPAKRPWKIDPFIGCYRYSWDTYRYLQNVMEIYRVLYDMYRFFFGFYSFPLVQSWHSHGKSMKIGHWWFPR